MIEGRYKETELIKMVALIRSPLGSNVIVSTVISLVDDGHPTGGETIIQSIQDHFSREINWICLGMTCRDRDCGG